MWSEKAGGICFVLVENRNIDTHTLHDTVPFNSNIFLEKEDMDGWSILKPLVRQNNIWPCHGKNTTPLPAIDIDEMAGYIKLIKNVGSNKVILTWAVMDHGRWGICLLIIPPCYHNNDIFSIFPHIMISESTLGELTSAQSEYWS